MPADSDSVLCRRAAAQGREAMPLLPSLRKLSPGPFRTMFALDDLAPWACGVLALTAELLRTAIPSVTAARLDGPAGLRASTACVTAPAGVWP